MFILNILYNIILLYFWNSNKYTDITIHSVIFSSLSKFSIYGLSENKKSVSRNGSLQISGTLSLSLCLLQGDTRNVIPLIVHITHFYYYKSIWRLVQN